ncbi:hypothetical protein [Marilutibacter chinensis]|uniref:Uncharacterized protein n=1 Tax=Marilutibacter chinensis TaxID=2912247 RepID=A0ABS9HY54_9GAMM|nr:hypothetical protein [Lysobacter chinensis]MCF7223794.1 hypothetical protein [Lysobacter chinensis]
MKKIFAALLLLAAPPASYAHELTSTFGDLVHVNSSRGSTTVEYCPDNTCEVFALSGPSAAPAVQDFAFAYLLGVSEYIYLEPFQSNGAAPAVQAVLSRYRKQCSQQSARAAGRCIVGVLAKRHPIRASFVRYDEGERNVVPISLAGFRDGT